MDYIIIASTFLRVWVIEKVQLLLDISNMPRIFLRLGTALLATIAILFLHINPLYGNENAWQQVYTANKYLKQIETTPWFLLAGEYNTKIWEQPYNGIYYSVDLGKSWNKLGLEGRGITDIKYFANNIYATTYYNVEGSNGLFVSTDGGKSFNHLGPNYTANNLEVNDYAIYIGTTSHGLWVSYNNGINWEQKIGVSTNYPGTKVIGLVANDHVVISTTQENAYRSEDMGNTWKVITELNGKQISNFCIQGNYVLAGSMNNKGMYISPDLGVTWSKIISWGDYSTCSIFCLNGSIYASKLNNEQGVYEILMSDDLGITWKNTNFGSLATQSNIIDYSYIYAENSFLYALSPLDGIYAQELISKKPSFFQFLTTPWDLKQGTELVDKITSFFDHKYPLLGYNSFSESEEFKKITTNFFGISDEIHNLYYSSHNGIDFKMDYGEKVLAPADGIATYYYCNACGNSIKIDHQNGYSTIYMHLQKEGLISNSVDQHVNVKTGDIIGKVGMSGNTTGPHLHISVFNGTKYPDNLVDPFGWLDMTKDDPWASYSWDDILGHHEGSVSNYLWEVLIPKVQKYLYSSDDTINFGNMEVKLLANSDSEKYTIKIEKSWQPYLNQAQKYLKYIPLTSVALNATNLLGTNISTFDSDIKIKYFLDDLDLSNVIMETLGIYYFDNITSTWLPLITELNLVDNTAETTTTHFSTFALFAKKIDETTPQTNIVNGNMDNWQSTYPLIELSTNNQTNTIFYRVNNFDWEQYTEPFFINKDGIFNLQYRAKDYLDNYELTKNQIIKIDTTGIIKDKLLVEGIKIEVAN